ncbi:hypothetical protein FHS31_001081 [Sphingomonas vulcanisoli]|uniref:VanZ family protein n=1 Tax=Sphingomonas vulcanisoli TaxID=1658060 RepID=A0ABX0TT92_9SPHN|nr:hypothetical protein [Sphingomonas vulcanisoli]NIJ07485.1 hypothetical protein [Sphingomonas vulcanisoli]
MHFLADRPRLLLAIRILFWIALAVLLFMALDPHPPQIEGPPGSDKVEHMLGFATLTLLAGLGYPRLPLLRLGEHLSFLGAMIEVAQAMPIVHRDCDIFDWVADTVAIAVVLAFISIVRKGAMTGK